MRFARLFVLLVAMLSISATAVGSASATAVEECQTQLSTLRSDTVDAQASFTSQKDFANLLLKLDATSTKLAEGKSADAVQKLVDFQTTLGSLATAPKPKVDPAVAASLIADAQTVIYCINPIGTT